MAWFRRRTPDAAPLPPPFDDAAQDRPEALRAAVYDVVALVNASAGRLPPAAVVAARRITDLLLEMVATADVRPLDVHAVISIRSTATDYLPTTVRSYLAVDASLVDIARASGRTPRAALLEQLDALEGATLGMLSASQQQDVDGLMTQGNFLRTKFAQSDLTV